MSCDCCPIVSHNYLEMQRFAQIFRFGDFSDISLLFYSCTSNLGHFPFLSPSRSLRTTNSTLTLRRNALIGGRGCLRLGFCSTCLGMLTPTYA